MNNGRKLKIFHIAILICLFILAFAVKSSASQKDGLLKIYFLDVGQGDAIFIEAPNGNQVLIDGGSGNKVLSELSKVMSFYDKDIDVVVASHPHSDHIGGLIEVLSRFDVYHIVEAFEKYDSSQYSAWVEAVTNEHANRIEALVGKEINLGNDVILTILHPFETFQDRTLKNPHDAGVVAMLSYKDFQLLLTGDAESPVERKIVQNFDIDIEVLKVGHHGSRTSTTQELISDFKPELAVIQVGEKNRYNHPSPEVIQRLENNGIKYYRSDIDGMVKLITDGRHFSVIR